jgi:hypothetical protein
MGWPVVSGCERPSCPVCATVLVRIVAASGPEDRCPDCIVPAASAGRRHRRTRCDACGAPWVWNPNGGCLACRTRPGEISAPAAVVGLQSTTTGNRTEGSRPSRRS